MRGAECQLFYEGEANGTAEDSGERVLRNRGRGSYEAVLSRKAVLVNFFRDTLKGHPWRRGQVGEGVTVRFKKEKQNGTGCYKKTKKVDR